jgi:ADP-L-glycero-D-manno-heptose 6-epimerase
MIVVTGGAGFIGSAFIRKLNQMGYENIIIVDRLRSRSKWLNLRKASFYEVISPETLEMWVEQESSKIHFFVHLGACSSTTETDVDFLLVNNLNYSKIVWNICTRLHIPLIYASSAATYGMGESGFSDDDASLQNLKPINPYGWSKHLFDIWAKKQIQQPPQWFGLKFFNVFGPNEYHKEHMQSVIAKATPTIIQEGYISLFKSHQNGIKDGEQQRDFIYIKDVMSFMGHIFLHHSHLPSGIYNLGTGIPRTFFDLGRSIFKALNMKESVRWIEMPENLRRQYQYFTAADMQKSLSDLSYTQKFMSLEESVKDYVHYLTAEDPYL